MSFVIGIDGLLGLLNDVSDMFICTIHMLNVTIHNFVVKVQFAYVIGHMLQVFVHMSWIIGLIVAYIIDQREMVTFRMSQVFVTNHRS